MSWEIILFLTSAIHGVILSVLFMAAWRNTRKRFLGIYLLAFSITILYYVNYWTQAFQLPLVLLWVGIVSSWIMPLAFYCYIKGNINFKYIIYHLLPISLFTVYFFGFKFVEVSDITFQIGKFIIVVGQLFLFIGYGIAILRNHTLKKEDLLFFIAYSSFVIGLTAYHLSVYLGFYTLRLDYIICGGFVVLTYGITYFSELSFLKERVKPKYSSSSLTKEDGDYLVQKINAVLEQNKYYKDPDFSLSSFAEKLGVPKYRISQALNAFSEKSFSELINEFRVEEAKVKLQDESSVHLKLEAIGEEVGFRNKVSFYKNFKKLVGSSPGEFREDHLQKSA